MARLNDLAHGKLDSPKLDPRDIIIRDGFNFRDTSTEAAQKHIAWLKESIRVNGVQEPIRVEFVDGKVYLVNGECRLRALQQLWDEGLEIYVPAMPVRGDEAEVLAKSMIANGALPPTKLEFGAAAARLIAYGWTKDKVSEYTPPHVAKSKAKAMRYVEEAVDLHEAPLAVKKAVKEGVEGVRISDSLALAATRHSRINAEEMIANAAKEAKAKGKTVAKRPKGAGKITKAKRQKEMDIEKCLGLADKLADAALDDGQVRAEVQKAARSYNRARSR